MITRSAPVPCPPGLSAGTLTRIPRDMRDDALQEAWLAQLEGREVDVAVWSFLKREERLARREKPFSQLSMKMQVLIQDEVAA